MKITTTGQPAMRPANAPLMKNPCTVKLDVPVFYNTERGPIPSNGGIVCSSDFAKTVLAALETWAKTYHFGIVHIGCYNPRMARNMNGTPILPARWSNHAFGTAIDFAGVLVGGSLVIVRTGELETGAAKKWAELITAVTTSITHAGYRPEVVREGGIWEHLGFYR